MNLNQNQKRIRKHAIKSQEFMLGFEIPVNHIDSGQWTQEYSK